MTATTLPRWLLLVGLAAGLMGAAWSVVRQVPATGLPAHTIAQVGDQFILRDQWLKAIAAAASERRTTLTAAQQKLMLDRLIHEELLVQHGLRLGLVQNDQRLRGQLIAEVLFNARASLADEPISDTELQAFYEANLGLFVPPAQLRVQAWTLQPDGQRTAFFPPVPDSLLPLHKLQQYLGPALVQTALTLPLGQDSQPISREAQSVILRVNEQQLAPTPALSLVRDAVQRELRRQREEAKVSELLAHLNQEFKVVRGDTP